MTDPSVVHGTFVIERTYDAPPARVFAAWAEPSAKRRWFAGPGDWLQDEHGDSTGEIVEGPGHQIAKPRRPRSVDTLRPLIYRRRVRTWGLDS